MMKYLLFAMLLFCSFKIQAEPDSLIERRLDADQYRFFFTYPDDRFFAGSMEIFDKYNNSVFYADSFYTSLNWDTLIDLNEDGKKELILDMSTGGLMYNYNMFVIFDFTKGPAPLFEIHNAELITGMDDVPKITSTERMSPSILGAGYIYSLKYEDGKIVLENDVSESKVLKSLVPREEDDLFMIDAYKAEIDECDENSDIGIFYHVILMQWKIVGDEKKGLKFFDKHYKCSNKKKLRKTLIDDVRKNYLYINDSNNYEFSSNNY